MNLPCHKQRGVFIIVLIVYSHAKWYIPLQDPDLVHISKYSHKIISVHLIAHQIFKLLFFHFKYKQQGVISGIVVGFDDVHNLIIKIRSIEFPGSKVIGEVLNILGVPTTDHGVSR